MATSQFTVYSASDPYGPGPITGTTGSLLKILNACLVDGYEGKPAAGWEKPFPDISSSLGCFRNSASGTGFYLLVNDSGGFGGAAEASLVGWETLHSLTSSNYGPEQRNHYTASIGAGWGQFPTPEQSLTVGKVVTRKSVDANSIPRYWAIFADKYTMYMFISNGAVANCYTGWMFGDIFSLAGNKDRYRCMIVGRGRDDISTLAASFILPSWAKNPPSASSTWDMFDQSYIYNPYSPSSIPNSGLSGYCIGHYMARTAGGGGSSIQVGKNFDTGKGCVGHGGSTCWFVHPMLGWLPAPNPTDNSYYLSPVNIIEPNASLIRGRWRGIYQVCHQSNNFTDGQIFQGSGDYAGKSFMIVKNIGSLGGFCAVEISPTVETN